MFKRIYNTLLLGLFLVSFYIPSLYGVIVMDGGKPEYGVIWENGEWSDGKTPPFKAVYLTESEFITLVEKTSSFTSFSSLNEIQLINFFRTIKRDLSENPEQVEKAEKAESNLNIVRRALFHDNSNVRKNTAELIRANDMNALLFPDIAGKFITQLTEAVSGEDWNRRRRALEALNTIKPNLQFPFHTLERHYADIVSNESLPTFERVAAARAYAEIDHNHDNPIFDKATRTLLDQLYSELSNKDQDITDKSIILRELGRRMQADVQYMTQLIQYESNIEDVKSERPVHDRLMKTAQDENAPFKQRKLAMDTLAGIHEHLSLKIYVQLIDQALKMLSSDSAWVGINALNRIRPADAIVLPPFYGWTNMDADDLHAALNRIRKDRIYEKLANVVVSSEFDIHTRSTALQSFKLWGSTDPATYRLLVPVIAQLKIEVENWEKLSDPQRDEISKNNWKKYIQQVPHARSTLATGTYSNPVILYNSAVEAISNNSQYVDFSTKLKLRLQRVPFCNRVFVPSSVSANP